MTAIRNDEVRGLTARQLFEAYGASVAYVSVRQPNGSMAMGTAFHVGEGVFLTARHVVDGNSIEEVATTIFQRIPDAGGNGIDGWTGERFRTVWPASGRVVSGPLFHPNEGVDVAALVIEGIECPPIPLGSHLDDWINDEAFVLAEVVVLGYPPIPQSENPVLVATRAEVNAVVDSYAGKHPRFIVSSMARGGFSGGPCLIAWDFALGIVTESLVMNERPEETGFLSILSVEPLYECLAHHGILPAVQKDGWDGFWDEAREG